MENTWNLVEKYYPNYSQSEEIARNNDLHRLMYEFYELEEDSSAMELYKKEFDSDINQVRSAYFENYSSILETALQKIANEQLNQLLAYSDKYEISIQFWPVQTTVFIAKNGVDLQDYSGDDAIKRGIEYLSRVTNNKR